MKNVLIAFILVLLTACSKEESPKDYREENQQEILTYIANNNLDTETSSSGLHYIITKEGTGASPLYTTDRVKVAYTGYLTDGTIFDESTDEGTSLNSLQNLIRGFSEGLSYFKEGGNGKLIIPAHLGYGSSDFGIIPAGSVLIFDIELIYVNYETENDLEIQNYLLDNDITAEKSETGLYYSIEELGNGKQPTLTDNVTITYKGYLTNGTVFDESASNINFNLTNLISGFAEGITYFKEGGNGTLFIPAHLAYGNNGTSGIPGGSVIIFDISLVSVN